MFKKININSLLNNKLYEGFTLIELLIVIAILAVLATTVTLVLNPTELIKQARDSTRLSDLRTLDSALAIHLTDTGGTNTYGSSSVVYISLADSTTTCANHTLPSLPSGWSYNCVTEENLTNTDSTGWIPVDFTSMSISSPLSRLPIDPVNTDTDGKYYTYVAGSYELSATMESNSMGVNGDKDVVSNDGGTSLGSYEVGSNLKLTPISVEDGGRDPELVAYYPLDQISGDTAFDSSGNNDGTLSDGISWVSGKKDNGISLDGVDDCVTISDSDDLKIDSDGSWSLWFYPTNISDHRQELISKHYNYEFSITMSTDGQVTFYHGDGSWTQIPSSGLSLLENDWNHLVITRDVDYKNINFYLNGFLIYSDGYSKNSTKGSYDMKIGCRPNSSLYFEGIIDEVRVYNRTLSASEVKAIYDSTN